MSTSFKNYFTAAFSDELQKKVEFSNGIESDGRFEVERNVEASQVPTMAYTDTKYAYN